MFLTILASTVYTVYMPQVTVYIRQEDLEVWKALRKKAEFLHTALQQADAYKALSSVERKVVKEHLSKLPSIPELPKNVGIIKTPKDAEKAVSEAFRKGEPIQRNARMTTWAEKKAGMGDSFELPPTKLCKIHGTPLDGRGKCLQKGCKYA